LASIKTVVTIVTGLALTNTLLVLITGGHYSRVIPISELSLVEIAFATVLIANIVRFYHGNVRHIDVTYGDESYAHAASGRHVEPRGGLGIDFFVVFGQSLMFSVASFYIGDSAAFLDVFVALLALDVLWAVYLRRDSDAVSSGWLWLLNDIGALIALVILLSVHRSLPDQAWPLDAGLGVVALTTAIDFALSWEFYFPRTVEGRVAGGATAATAHGLRLRR